MNIKEQIIINSINLFNKYGINNVSLKKISVETGINTGHLYHYYKKKEDILYAILDKLIIDFNKSISKDYLATDYIKLMIDNTILSHTSYIFFYRDLFVIFLEYPEFKSIFMLRFERRMNEITKVFNLFIDKGYLIPAIREKLHLLCHVFWFNSTFWSLSLEISNEVYSDESLKKLRNTYKNFLLPYLTEEGKKTLTF